MAKLCILGFFLILASPTLSFAQEILGFSCGFAGTATPVVEEVTSWASKGESSKLLKALHEGSSAQQVLALVTLEELAKMNRVVLEQADLDQISGLLNSQAKVKWCSGCTVLEQVSLKELLREDDPYLLRRLTLARVKHALR